MRPLPRFLCAFLLGMVSLYAEDTVVASGDAKLTAALADATQLCIKLAGSNQAPMPLHPVFIEVDGESISGRYAQIQIQAGSLLCEGAIRSPNGTLFLIHDHYRSAEAGAFRLTREVVVSNPKPSDKAFNSGFSIALGQSSSFSEHEFFVPAIWYRTNFSPPIAGALASQAEDHIFLFREDRLPLPMVAARNRFTARTVSIVHADATPATFSGDEGSGRVVDERLQFGSIGVTRQERVSLNFLFPGSEGERTRTANIPAKGWALRSHPIRIGVPHRYELIIRVSETLSYPRAVERSWRQAFELYRPALRPVDVHAAFRGLLDTLDHYSIKKGDGVDAPGFPFSVLLPEGKVRAYNYQMGFIGRQIPNAFYLLSEGINQSRRDWRDKAEQIIDFWARECPAPDGFPRTWYDPSRDPDRSGRWRSADNKHGGTALRVASTGMEGMIEAWSLCKRTGEQHPQWFAACQGFGDWLVKNQNADGSFFLAYASSIADGHRLPVLEDKSASTNPIRFLVSLYEATRSERYLHAAVRAGEFCLLHSHDAYRYAGSVVDNPVTLDRESGQEALASFLALYDSTQESRWLNAAIQAANYTETWMISYEIPPVAGLKQGFPEDRSIVGQTLIATGLSAADLGFAFSAYDYYRLYLFTEDRHFLHVAQLLIHNTKQALNWDGTLYPGLPRGLQLEAFSVSMPRRRGVMECLSWNFAAHLDPLVRLKQRFGDFDLDVIERLPLSERQRFNTGPIAGVRSQ